MNFEERIRLEEITRHNTQKELKKITLWDFINSSFGLWLLSTFLLGFITYQHNKSTQQSIHKIESDRIEIELKHRLALFYKSIKNINQELENIDEDTDPWGLKYAIRIRNNYRFINKSESAFFSSHANDNIQSLFIELQDKLKDFNIKKSSSINDCIPQLADIRKFCEDEYNNVPRPDNPKVHKAYFDQIKYITDNLQQILSTYPLSQWTKG